MTFMTERETEDLLRLRTRDLKMPDGSSRPFTTTIYAWNSYDYLTEGNTYTPDELIEIIVHDAQLASYDLDHYFPEALAYLSRELHLAMMKLLDSDQPRS